MTEGKEKKSYSLKRGLIIAAALFVFDAFCLNQGMIAVITILIIIVWWLPKLLYKAIRKRDCREVLLKIAIYGCMAVLVFAANRLNNKMAKSRADFLVSVITTYHSDTGAFPEKLMDLVPEYMPSVPKAKYAFSHNDYMYIHSEDAPLLLYTALPPFGRPTYNFGTRKWSYLD